MPRPGATSSSPRLGGGSYACTAVTEKGQSSRRRASRHSSARRRPASRSRCRTDHRKSSDLVKIKQWLEGHFEDPLWESIADICIGCGACAFICPACHCFDINDEGSADNGDPAQALGRLRLQQVHQPCLGPQPARHPEQALPKPHHAQVQVLRRQVRQDPVHRLRQMHPRLPGGNRHRRDTCSDRQHETRRTLNCKGAKTARRRDSETRQKRKNSINDKDYTG